MRTICVLIILVGFIQLSLGGWRRITVYRWRRHLSLDRHYAVYTQLFESVNGFFLSKHARRSCDAFEYVYGEIDFFSFIALLSLTKPNQETIFYDLGSGVGKAVIACAMAFPVKESHGIELFQPLHEAACRQRCALESMPEYAPAYRSVAKRIYFLNGDLFQADIHSATLIFINATGFFGSSWTHLSNIVSEQTQCRFVISTSKPLKSDAFFIAKKTIVQMSWGLVDAYVQERVCPESAYCGKGL